MEEIQDSINTIWGLKPKPKKGWIKVLQNRFLSFSIIVSLGFLLLVSLVLSSFIDGFSDYLKVHFKEITVIALYIINNLITLIITIIIFAVIFKVLPDGKIKMERYFCRRCHYCIIFYAGQICYFLLHQ
ncbi:MAG: YhjD/YihY/BrkB family envelope integrity protein [Ferruginibacter sp.]